MISLAPQGSNDRTQCRSHQRGRGALSTRRLQELARERVSATLLASATVRHADRVCAVVMARCQPGSRKVVWVTLLHQTGDIQDQVIRAKAAAAITALRAQTGIPAE